MIPPVMVQHTLCAAAGSEFVDHQKGVMVCPAPPSSADMDTPSYQVELSMMSIRTDVTVSTQVDPLPAFSRPCPAGGAPMDSVIIFVDYYLICRHYFPTTMPDGGSSKAIMRDANRLLLSIGMRFQPIDRGRPGQAHSLTIHVTTVLPVVGRTDFPFWLSALVLLPATGVILLTSNAIAKRVHSVPGQVAMAATTPCSIRAFQFGS